MIYLVLVVPYRSYMKKQGTTVFGDPDPTKTCPECLSSDLPVEAKKCKYSRATYLLQHDASVKPLGTGRRLRAASLC